jgi:capsular exopolysaccharide synthesis family protein
MSHLRNLFHKTTGPEPIPLAVAATPIQGNTTVADLPAEAPAAPAAFPAEEAHLRAEIRLAYYSDPRSPAADRYRLLRMRLKELWRSGRLKKLLITSPLAHDGKSTVTLNLATALAERGKHSVLVVEADLHHSTLAENLKLRHWAGLTECLVDGISPLSAIRKIDPFGWCFLPAGEPRKNPTELLQTPVFGQVLQKLAPYFDWILIDSPPVIPLTDSLSLQQHADGCLLVARAGQTPREALEQTVELLGKQKVLGVVLNGVEPRNHLYYQYHEYNRSSQED